MASLPTPLLADVEPRCVVFVPAWTVALLDLLRRPDRVPVGPAPHAATG